MPGGTTGSGVAAEVVDELKGRVRRGVYGPGDKLPSERALSEELGVSRPTIREAIRALAAMNIVSQRHGSGVYVRSLDVFELLEPVRFALEVSEPTLASLFQVRLALEPLSAQLAAARATDAEIRHLSSIAEAATASRVSVSRFLELDTALHEALVLASHDELLRTIISSLAFLAHESRERTVRQPGVRESTIRDHAAIVRAVENRDSRAAGEAMDRHLRNLLTASGTERRLR
ncbi:MAG TPA: FadR/GntR family transcriptional regulator [Gaiellaceae bacterium]|nr:FadR/GntR family transcriptional regulator [Gaiellaceae bacterium]